jgi:DNA repair photolyase
MVSCAPLLPLINDGEEALDHLAREASASGACRLWANVLFLKSCARAVFLPFLEKEFPSLARRYRERFERSAYLRGEYPNLIRERLDRIRSRHGLDRALEAPEPELWPRDAQLSLFPRTSDGMSFSPPALE